MFTTSQVFSFVDLPSFMNYQQTIDYLFSRLPMFSRIGAAAIRKDITNTVTLCNRLDNPQNKFRSIHVAGTNGKGSVSHMLASVFQKAGYKTGLYTSPHLKDFRERIKINGMEIPQENVVQFVKLIKPVIEEIDPSFFEITVSMAFDYFQKERVDIAIIEVGLGGRLDSTNIINPELSIITNIGWDHMNLLGDTLEKIAREKAGIIKDGVPVVIGESSSQTRHVFEASASLHQSPIIFADQSYYISGFETKNSDLVVEVADKQKDEHRKYHLDLTGVYQTKNLLTVLQAIAVLKNKGFTIEEEHIEKGLRHVKKNTGLHGRWEIVQNHPTIALDVAHNIDGMRQLVNQVELADYSDLHIVIGMVKDKDVDNILSILPKEAAYYFTKANIPRAMPENQLHDLGQSKGLVGNAYASVNLAVQAARSVADKKDLIVICGSVFIVGEVIGIS